MVVAVAGPGPGPVPEIISVPVTVLMRLVPVIFSIYIDGVMSKKKEKNEADKERERERVPIVERRWFGIGSDCGRPRERYRVRDLHVYRLIRIHGPAFVRHSLLKDIIRILDTHSIHEKTFEWENAHFSFFLTVYVYPSVSVISQAISRDRCPLTPPLRFRFPSSS